MENEKKAKTMEELIAEWGWNQGCAHILRELSLFIDDDGVLNKKVAMAIKNFSKKY